MIWNKILIIKEFNTLASIEYTCISNKSLKELSLNIEAGRIEPFDNFIISVKMLISNK